MAMSLLSIAASSLLLLTLSFCNSPSVENKAQPGDINKNTVQSSDNVKKNYLDTIIKDIPKEKTGNPVWYYLMQKEAEKKLGFKTLDSGFDSIEIRIWRGYVFSAKEQVVIIKNSNSKWKAELYNLTRIYDNNSDSVLSVKKDIIIAEPKSGWSTFMDKLFKLNILTLPAYSKIPNYRVPMDGDGVNIQVATRTNYRIYFYPEPKLNADKILEAKQVTQILELISNELDFKWVR